MKLVSLNTGGAAQGEIFFDYIKQQAKAADIFCFQEIFSSSPPAPKISSGAHMHLFEELQEILPGFEGIFTARSNGCDFNGPVDFPVEYGLAVFIRKSIKVINCRVVDMDSTVGIQDDPTEGITKAQVLNLALEGITKAQVLNLALKDKVFFVVNYHGPALPGNKLDTPQRIANSEALKGIWESLAAKAKILCGDFNLMPETESIKILGKCGRDLIKEFKITNTRNEISWKKYHNKQSFADYIFTSPEINVKSFEVSYNEVSDHLPMLLEFELA